MLGNPYSRIWEIFAGGIRNRGKFYSLKRNPGLWNPEYSSRNFGIPYTIGIQNPSSTDKDWRPVPAIPNPLHGIQNPRLSWIPLRGEFRSLSTRNHLNPGGLGQYLGMGGRFPFSQNFRNFRFGGKWNTFRRFVLLENSQKKWKI